MRKGTQHLEMFVHATAGVEVAGAEAAAAAAAAEAAALFRAANCREPSKKKCMDGAGNTPLHDCSTWDSMCASCKVQGENVNSSVVQYTDLRAQQLHNIWARGGADENLQLLGKRFRTHGVIGAGKMKGRRATGAHRCHPEDPANSF